MIDYVWKELTDPEYLKDLIKAGEEVQKLWVFKWEGENLFQLTDSHIKPLSVLKRFQESSSKILYYSEIKEVIDPHMDQFASDEEVVEIDGWKASKPMYREIEKVLKNYGLVMKMNKDTSFNIVKPEPDEPLIVKSGDTWVIRWKGIDYLCMNPEDYDFAGWGIRESSIDNILRCLNDWKSFTGPNPDITELTDDIAKLRPMVRVPNYPFNVYKLVYIDNENCLSISDRKANVYHLFSEANVYHLFSEPSNTRLATAKELQEAAE